MSIKHTRFDPEEGAGSSRGVGTKDGPPPPEGFGASFTDQRIRARFIKKVYLIILAQLAVTASIVALFSHHPAIRSFVRNPYNSNGLTVYITGYVIFFVTYLGIVCVPSLRRKHPINIITLSIFTLALSLMTGVISVYHDVQWVWMAMAITCAITLALTLFSFQTKWDFTGWGPYIFAFHVVVIIFGFVAIIYWQTGRTSQILNLVYCALFGLVFSMYLVYDTQRMIGGKKNSISPEEHVYAAVEIYLDVVMIFLAVLGLGGKD